MEDAITRESFLIEPGWWEIVVRHTTPQRDWKLLLNEFGFWHPS